MPISYTIDPVKQLVTTRLWGVSTDDEVRGHNMQLRADPAFNPGYRQLADLTEVTESRVSMNLVSEQAADQFFTPGTPRAFVAATDAIFGLTRMFALQSEAQGQTIQVFRDMESAKKWLGL
jgi:hypothetical protein